MHAIDLLLECLHINIEQIEASIFIPLVNERRTCNVCHKQTIIIKVGMPYWISEEDLKRWKKAGER